MTKKKVKIDKTIILKMETVSLLSTKNDQLEKNFSIFQLGVGHCSLSGYLSAPKLSILFPS
jgi:hypothetical protein